MSGRVAPLLWTLKRGAPDEQARAGHAIYQLQSMGGDPYKNDAEIVSALVDQGAIPLAVELMGKASGPVQEVAALILRPIAQKVDALRQKVLGAGVVSPLLKMLQQGPEKGPAHYAAGLIVNLAYDAGGAKEIREQGALPLLFTLAQDPRTPSFGRYQAIDAMGTLAKFDEESARVVSTAPGILQLLVTSLADAGTAAVAASALGHLSCGRQWAVEMVQRAGAIPALIQAFNTPDDDQLDKAVHALLQIASTGEAVWPEIVQAGGLDAIFGALEKRDVPGRCVQSCGACIVYWLWKKEDLRGPIHTALASFVHALGPRLASTVEAERVTALKGLLHLVDGKKFKEPTISAALVHSGVIPLAVSAAADLRPAVQALAIQILHGLSASGDQPAAREALIKFDFAAPVMRMLHSTDPLVKADAAELLTQLVMFEERTDAWWADPPTLLRPADFVTHRLVAAGIIPICLQWIRDPAETEAVRVAGALTLTRVCCYRMWGQVALQHALGIPAAIEILVRPDTPADLRRACAFLLANAVKKNEHATWTFVQAGGVAALFQALELTDKGEYLERTVDGLMTTLRHAWEIVPPRTHIFPVLKAFVDRIVGSAGGSWEKRDRLLLGLYTAVDPELAAVDATLQDAFIQAGAFTLLVPMVADPITAAQVWAAKILRCLVTANHATKRTLNNYGGLEKLFEALKVGNAEVREEVLRCLGEALAEAGELSVIAIKKWEAVKLLSQCVVHGEPAVQERAMWVIGRMTLHQAVVARLMGQNKPKQLISILIQKAKDTAATPTTQYYAVYALEFLTAAPQDNVKLALKGGMVPVFIDIIKSSAAEDRTRIRALSTLTDNSRAYYRFSGKCSRCGIYKLTWKLKDDPEASPAVQEAAGKAYKEMWKALGEGFFYSCGLTFDMRTNMLNASRGRI